MMPKRVEPLADGQVVYTAPAEAMGFVVALDAATKKELWRARIYQVSKNPDLEGDVQDVFITKLAKDGGTLIVADERNRTYRLDLTTKNVTPVGPVAK
jgi:glucose dehydrogenase